MQGKLDNRRTATIGPKTSSSVRYWTKVQFSPSVWADTIGSTFGHPIQQCFHSFAESPARCATRAATHLRARYACHSRWAWWPVAAAITAPATSAQDLGRVILRSGNPVVGVVEQLRRGDLDLDTDEMGLVSIDWDDIALVTSTRIFEVTDVFGFQYFGRLAPTDQERTLVVALGQFADTLAFSEVVEITYIGQGFLTKTAGFVDMSTSLTRANNLASLLLKGRFAYRGQRWDVDWNGETYFQRQETTTDDGEVFEEQTSRNSTSVTLKRFFRGFWAATTSTEIEQNEELSLDHRILVILRGQYNIIRNQSMELSLGLGGALNRETFTGEDATSSAEITGISNFDAFDIGDLDISMATSAFFAPADGGRFRLNVDVRLAWEIFNDFAVGFNVTERFDSEPPNANAGRDFHYAVTIGWSWG